MKSKHGLIAKILIILICIAFLPSSPVAAQSHEMQDATLYYSTNNDLVTGAPNETQGQTFSFGPSLMVMPTDVGRWSTGPLVKSIQISGSIDTVFWASGSGVVYFEIRLNINGEYTGILLTSGSLPLSSSPQEITSSASGVDLELAADDVFEVYVSIYLLGTNVDIYWGSAEHPSNIILPCNSVEVGTPGHDMDVDSEKLIVNTTVVSAFGVSDITNCSIQFQGPSGAEHIIEQDPETKNGSLIVYWVWEYGKDQTKSGEEYTILINVIDNSGNTWSANASEPIVLELNKGNGIQGNILLAIILIIVLAAVILFIARRYFGINIFKRK